MTQHRTSRKTLSDGYANEGRAIAVLRIEPGRTPGTLAVLSVKIGGIIVRDVRINELGKGLHINLPSRCINNVWVDLVEIQSQALRAAVEDECLAALAGLGGQQ